MSESFDRIRPPRDRPPVRDGVDPTEPRGDAGQGRAALFSVGPDRGEAAGGRGAAVAVRCSRCGATTGLDARTALRTAMPLVVIAPWRRAPVFARCPGCRRRSWLALEVGS